MARENMKIAAETFKKYRHYREAMTETVMNFELEEIEKWKRENTTGRHVIEQIRRWNGPERITEKTAS